MVLPYPEPSSPAVSAIMRANRKADTRPELALRSAVHCLGLRYRVDLAIVAGGLRVKPDMVFTRARIAIFVDGCFWHRCLEHGTSPRSNAWYWGPKLDANEARDRRVDVSLKQAGWRVIRIWEHELPTDAAARVERCVRRELSQR